jgi:hypothetical protein
MTRDLKVNVRVTGNDDELRKTLNSASKGVKSFADDAKKLGTELATKISAGIAVVAAGITAVVVRTADDADAIDKAAIRTGLTREELQQLRYATDQLGVSAEGVEGAIAALTARMPQIASGAGDTHDALRAIGVSARDADGNLRSMGDLFPDIVRGLGKVANETERNALATQLFGRGASELTPMLAAGGAEIDRLMKRASELGLVMSDDNVQAFVVWKDMLGEVQMQLSAVGARIASAFLPIATKVVGFVQDKVVPVFQRFAEWLDNVSDATKETVGMIALVLAGLGPLVMAIAGVAGMLAFMLTPAGLAFAAIAALATIAVVVTKNWDVLKLQGTLAWTAIKDAVFTAVDGILGMLERMTSKIPLLGGKVSGLRAEFNEFAEGSLAKSGQRIYQLERGLNDAAGAATTLTAAVETAAGDGGTSGGLSLFGAKATAAQDAIQKLITGLRDAAVMNELLGDRFDLTSANAREYETAVRALVAAGVSLDAVVGPQGETLRELAAKYSGLAVSIEKAEEKKRKLKELEEEGLSVTQSVMTAQEEHAAKIARLDALLAAKVITEQTHTRAVKEATDELHAQGRAITESLMTPMEKYSEQLRILDEQLASGGISQETWARGVARAGVELDEALGRVRDLRISLEDMAGRGADAVIDFAGGAKGALSDFARHALREIGRVIARTLILRALFPQLALAGGGGGDILGMIFRAPGRAIGGPVMAGRPYWVGEHDKELFVPTQSGRIMPMAAAAGGGASFPDASSLPPYPRVMSPEALAVDDYWRRAFHFMTQDYRDRGGT